MNMDNHIGNTKILTLPKNPPPPPPSQYFKSVQSNNSTINSDENSTENSNKNSKDNSTKISSKYLPMNSINKRAVTPTNILTENSTQNSAKNSSMNSIENSKQEDMIYHGEVINDRYKIDKQIGSGIYGQVFKAFDQKDQIDVAIKIIKKGERFQRQAKTEIHLLELIRNTRDSNRMSCKQSAIFFKSCICIAY